jgi:hypothetical protein
MNEKFTWHFLVNATWVLKDSWNHIQAHVMRPGLHSTDWIAMAEGRTLGKFLSPEVAKQEVEKTLGIRT